MHSGFLAKSDTNRLVLSQKMASGLKFRVWDASLYLHNSCQTSYHVCEMDDPMHLEQRNEQHFVKEKSSSLLGPLN